MCACTFEASCRSPFTSMISFHWPNYSERLAGQKYSQGQMRKQEPPWDEMSGPGSWGSMVEKPRPLSGSQSQLYAPAPEPSAQTPSYLPGFCMPQAGLGPSGAVTFATALVGIIVCKVGVKVPLWHALVLPWTLDSVWALHFHRKTATRSGGGSAGL